MYSPNPAAMRGVLTNDGSRAIAAAMQRIAAMRMQGAQQAAEFSQRGSENFGSALGQGISEGSGSIRDALVQKARMDAQKQQSDAELAERIRATNLNVEQSDKDRTARQADAGFNRASDWGRMLAQLGGQYGIATMEGQNRREMNEEDIASRERMSTAENASREKIASIRESGDAGTSPYTAPVGDLYEAFIASVNAGTGKEFVKKFGPMLSQLSQSVAPGSPEAMRLALISQLAMPQQQARGSNWSFGLPSLGDIGNVMMNPGGYGRSLGGSLRRSPSSQPVQPSMFQPEQNPILPAGSQTKPMSMWDILNEQGPGR